MPAMSEALVNNPADWSRTGTAAARHAVTGPPPRWRARRVDTDCTHAEPWLHPEAVTGMRDRTMASRRACLFTGSSQLVGLARDRAMWQFQEQRSRFGREHGS